jgi:hypothetical protein
MFDNCLTKRLKYGQIALKPISMPIKKDPKTVSVREFLRNFKKLTGKKETLIIQKNGKPDVVFVTYDEWLKNQAKKPHRVFTIEELEKFTFKGGDQDLSMKIDEILLEQRTEYERNR